MYLKYFNVDYVVFSILKNVNNKNCFLHSAYSKKEKCHFITLLTCSILMDPKASIIKGH